MHPAYNSRQIAVSEKYEYIPALFSDIIAKLTTHHDARARSATDVPMSTAAGQYLHDFVHGDWAQVGSWRQKAILQLPQRNRQVVQAGADMLLLRLRRISPVNATDAQDVAAFFDRLCETAQVAGEWLVGMKLVGESDESIEFTRVMFTEILHQALLAGTAFQIAASKKCDISDLAPAVLASMISRAQSADNLDEHKAASKYNLHEGSRLSLSEFDGIAATMTQVLRTANHRITESLRTYTIMATEALEPVAEEEPWWLETDPLRDYYPKEPRALSPRIHIGPLLAFGASAGGGSEDARVRGAFDLFHCIVSQYLAQQRALGIPNARLGAFNEGVYGLKNLEKVISSERATHRDVEQRWREIEQEMKFLQRQNPKGKAVYPFPDEFTALERRALYYQDAISRGVPLGTVLAELYDSPKMTFGPSERLFFERTAFYAARKFSSNFVAQTDPRLNGDHRLELRLEDVRGVLSNIEAELRRQEHLSDDELLALGQSLLTGAVRNGELRNDELRYLTGVTSQSPWGGEQSSHRARSNIIVNMVLRARAAQEVRELTAVIALDGEIGTEVVANYRHLPHTRSSALLDPAESQLSLINARNGQTLAELERDSRARWLRYRQQMPDGVDVSPILVPGANEVEIDNPMRLKSRRHFRPRPPEPPPARYPGFAEEQPRAYRR